MPDVKISGLTAASSLATTDLVETTVDPGGTPLSRKATLAQVGQVIGDRWRLVNSYNLSSVASQVITLPNEDAVWRITWSDIRVGSTQAGPVVFCAGLRFQGSGADATWHTTRFGFGEGSGGSPAVVQITGLAAVPFGLYTASDSFTSSHRGEGELFFSNHSASAVRVPWSRYFGQHDFSGIRRHFGFTTSALSEVGASASARITRAEMRWTNNANFSGRIMVFRENV
jgi:hypothetical protein